MLVDVGSNIGSDFVCANHVLSAADGEYYSLTSFSVAGSRSDHTECNLGAYAVNIELAVVVIIVVVLDDGTTDIDFVVAFRQVTIQLDCAALDGDFGSNAGLGLDCELKVSVFLLSVLDLEVAFSYFEFRSSVDAEVIGHHNYNFLVGFPNACSGLSDNDCAHGLLLETQLDVFCFYSVGSFLDSFTSNYFQLFAAEGFAGYSSSDVAFEVSSNGYVEYYVQLSFCGDSCCELDVLGIFHVVVLVGSEAGDASVLGYFVGYDLNAFGECDVDFAAAHDGVSHVFFDDDLLQLDSVFLVGAPVAGVDGGNGLFVQLDSYAEVCVVSNFNGLGCEVAVNSTNGYKHFAVFCRATCSDFCAAEDDAATGCAGAVFDCYNQITVGSPDSYAGAGDAAVYADSRSSLPREVGGQLQFSGVVGYQCFAGQLFDGDVAQSLNGFAHCLNGAYLHASGTSGALSDDDAVLGSDTGIHAVDVNSYVGFFSHFVVNSDCADIFGNAVVDDFHDGSVVSGADYVEERVSGYAEDVSVSQCELEDVAGCEISSNLLFEAQYSLTGFTVFHSRNSVDCVGGAGEYVHGNQADQHSQDHEQRKFSFHAFYSSLNSF